MCNIGVSQWLIALGWMLALTTPACATDGPWIAFTHGNDQVGFKDAQGTVRIEPTLFQPMTPALRFDHIIAAGEKTTSGARTYYLLKDGREIAPNSVYYHDNVPACESEDSIRFRDRQHDKVGFLDGQGEILIPATLDDATPLRNGIALVLKGATRICAGHPDRTQEDCDHWIWEGGTQQLIDRHGKTLVEDINATATQALDWYSLDVSPQPPTDPLRVAFKGVDGRYYGFVDIQKDFAIWLRNEFLPHLDDASLKAHSYARLWHGQGNEPLNDWQSTPATEMLRRYGAALRKRLTALRDSDGFGLAQEPMAWPFDAIRDPQYFDNCGEFAQWKTPKISVREHWQQGSFEPDKHASFDFIRTPKGYRLLAFSIPKPQ